VKVFVIGATGHIGSHVSRRLKSAGHEVLGLARSGEAEAKLRAWALDSIAGDVADQATLHRGVRASEAVIFAPQLGEIEGAIVAWLLEQMEESGKTFIFTSGTGVLAQRTAGAWSEDTFAEDDPFTPLRSLKGRADVETMVRAASQRGIRGIVVRPPVVWVHDHLHAVVRQVVDSVSKTGAACYVGAGLNLYSHVHAEDLAEAFRLVLEKGEGGAVYHAVAGETPNRWIADMVARVMNCGTRSISLDEAIELWGRFSALVVMGVCSRSRSPKTRALGWTPTRFDMLAHAEAVLRRDVAAAPGIGLAASRSSESERGSQTSPPSSSPVT
jgi:nucleoside-diphosphate-sugar epimerase